MTVVPFAAILTLAWFAATNLAISFVLWAAVSMFGRAHDGSATTWLAARVAPAAISLAFTIGVFVPGHWLWEPAHEVESAGYTVVALALCGCAILAVTILRAVHDVRLTRSTVASWRAAAVRSSEAASPLPVVDVATPYPVMSLVGTRRPALFMTKWLADTLTAEELDVSVAHEVAHARTHDNVKRLLVAWCPDVLGWSAAGREIDQRWRAAMEFEADDRAVAGDERRALTLAGALVKIARLTPACMWQRPVTMSHIHHADLLTARVERLVARSHPSERAQMSWLFALLATMAAASMIAAAPHAWLSVHQLTERLVSLLP